MRQAEPGIPLAAGKGPGARCVGARQLRQIRRARRSSVTVLEGVFNGVANASEQNQPQFLPQGLAESAVGTACMRSRRCMLLSADLHVWLRVKYSDNVAFSFLPEVACWWAEERRLEVSSRHQDDHGP